MNRMNAMQIFVRVAELAGFTRAAESLGMPKASVSTAVQQLESELGTQLLLRTTRKVQMTPDGQAFYERCKDLLADFDELQGMFQQGPEALRGRLRVDMNSAIASKIVIPRLPEFMHRHPHVEIELSSSDRRVDLIAEGFDCVLRVGTLEDSSLIAKPIGELHVINCASRGYLDARGTPMTLGDLADHDMIHYATTLGSKPTGFEYFDGSSYRNVPMRGGLTVNSVEAYDASCLAGLGIIQVPEEGMRRHLEQGTIVQILPNYQAEPMPVSLLYARRRNVSKRVQVFMTWLSGVLGTYVGSD